MSHNFSFFSNILRCELRDRNFYKIESLEIHSKIKSFTTRKKNRTILSSKHFSKFGKILCHILAKVLLNFYLNLARVTNRVTWFLFQKVFLVWNSLENRTAPLKSAQIVSLYKDIKPLVKSIIFEQNNLCYFLSLFLSLLWKNTNMIPKIILLKTFFFTFIPSKPYLFSFLSKIKNKRETFSLWYS